MSLLASRRARFTLIIVILIGAPWLVLSGSVRPGWSTLIPFSSDVSDVAASDSRAYVVAPDGNDGNPGTQEAPLGTISAGLLAATPGDSIVLRGGSYPQTQTLIVASSGTEDEPITIRAFPGETPIVDGNGMVGDVIRIESATWLTLEGLTVQNAGDPAGVALNIIRNSSHITLRSIVAREAPVAAIAIGTTVSHVGIFGCDVSGSSAGLQISGQHVFVDGCRSHDNDRMVNDGADCGLSTTGATGGEHGAQGFSLYNTPGPVEILNSTVVDNIAQSLCYGADGVAFELYNAQDIRIHHNQAWGNTNTIESAGDTEGVRFWRNEVTSDVFLTAHQADGMMIVNNTIWNGKPSIWIGPSKYGDGSSAGFVFVNNIVTTARSPLFFISFAWDPRAVVDHNLYFTLAPLADFGYIGGAYYKSFANWQVGSGLDKNSRLGDPLLTAPDNADFRPQPSSPAIDGGMVVSGITDDFTGSAPDIGAREFPQ